MESIAPVSNGMMTTKMPSEAVQVAVAKAAQQQTQAAADVLAKSIKHLGRALDVSA